MPTSRVLLLSVVLTALLLGCKASPKETPDTSATTTSATSATTSTTTSTTGTAVAFGTIPPVVISGAIPTDVPVPNVVPPDTPSEQFRPFFDWFSWESFIALNWPASNTGRGNPDQPNNPSVFTGMTNSTPVTWGTYKANWELFDQYDKRPTPWNDYSSPYAPALCPQAKQTDKQLLMVTKGDTELSDVNQAFSFPLVDQQSNFVYFEVRYNQPQYEWIRGADSDKTTWLYLMQNLPPCKRNTTCTGVALPPNAKNVGDSIMIKAAWRNLSGMERSLRQRYYSVNAWVYNSQTQQCSQQLMGLVGFHIAQKTSLFTEWVWSSFEQVDNVPPKAGNVPSSFNNGTDNPSTGTQGFANRPTYTAPGQLPPTATPTQVTRLNPIPTTPPGASTVDVNNAFHAALPKSSVWQNYQLVITQWPTNPTQFKAPANRGVYPEDAGAPFPVNGAVNVALETYFQSAQVATGAFGNSCMSCHFNAGTGLRDFSWGLTRRPHQDAPPPSTSKMKSTAK
jgi:hypothetical protein